MKNIFKKITKNTPFIKKILNDRDILLKERDVLLEKLKSSASNTSFTHENFSPGHFYSVIPNLEEVKKNEDKIFTNNKEIAAIDLNESEQIKLFNKFSIFYKDLTFSEEKSKKNRYFYKNPNYGYGDAVVLYSMIRHFRPKRIIEIGSGFSSCVTLDTNEKFFKNKIKCSFVEPYCDLLKSLIRSTDNNEIIEKNLQDIPKDFFKSLKKNDILFIDSTHVSKVGSDVNYIIFEILPILNPGVIIHFHDVFHPFEYPKEWIYKGFFWNEIYLLRSFLEYNNSFKIIFFNHFFYKYHFDLLKQKTPLILKNPGGGIWIKKL